MRRYGRTPGTTTCCIDADIERTAARIKLERHRRPQDETPGRIRPDLHRPLTQARNIEPGISTHPEASCCVGNAALNDLSRSVKYLFPGPVSKSAAPLPRAALDANRINERARNRSVVACSAAAIDLICPLEAPVGIAADDDIIGAVAETPAQSDHLSIAARRG